MLLYLAAGDIEKYTKHKQRNEAIKDNGDKINTMLALFYAEILSLITHPTNNQYADNCK